MTRTAFAEGPSSPGMLNTPVSSEDSTYAYASPGPSSRPDDRSSSSFDTKRSHSGSGRVRTGSGSGHARNRDVGGSGSIGSIPRMDHPYARSPLVSPAEVDDDDVPLESLNERLEGAARKEVGGSSAYRNGSSPVVRTPVDRLPSPPLTPVASKENMRRPGGKGSKSSSPDGENSQGIVDANTSAATDNSNRDRLGNGLGHGELSTWFDSTANSAPGSEHGAEQQEEEEEGEMDITFAKPLNANVSLTSLNRDKDLPDRPRSSIPPLPVKKASFTSQNPIGPMGGTMSPQPWEVVDPPPGNNGLSPSQGDLQMQELRPRNASLKSTASGSRNVVVKNGKRYRIPRSSYYFGPPVDTSVYGTDPIGHIGEHHPREIIRIERDYSGGELVQFSPAYPLELEGRVTPTQFLEAINTINESLIEAHSLRWSFFDNALAFFTLYISRIFLPTYYDRRMRRLQRDLEGLNRRLYNPQGLNILWPKDVAFMFLEIEYY